MSKSIELTVKVNPLWVEYVSDVLIEKIGCCGVVTDEKYYKDEVIINENNGNVKGYMALAENNHVNHDNIRNILFQERESLVSSGIDSKNLGEWTVSFAEIADEEWTHSWKQYWHPQKISEKVVICPSWEEYSPEEDEIIINLDPGSAFGTGTHPTTKLCVQALEEILNVNVQSKPNCHCEKGQRPDEAIQENFSIASLPLVARKDGSVNVADIGTGSGILSIAAIKLGAESAVGVDNDASVISVAQENAEKNNIADKCRFYTGVASDVKGEYEIVIANILAHILIEAMPELAVLVKQCGKLILSGIILKKSQDVQDSCTKNGLKIVGLLQEDSWVAIIAEKL